MQILFFSIRIYGFYFFTWSVGPWNSSYFRLLKGNCFIGLFISFLEASILEWWEIRHLLWWVRNFQGLDVDYINWIGSAIRRPSWRNNIGLFIFSKQVRFYPTARFSIKIRSVVKIHVIGSVFFVFNFIGLCLQAVMQSFWQSIRLSLLFGAKIRTRHNEIQVNFCYFWLFLALHCLTQYFMNLLLTKPILINFLGI